MESFDKSEARKNQVKSSPKPPSSSSSDNFKKLDIMGFGYAKDVHMWTAPFIMSVINSKVVRRSNELMNGYYGKNFKYHEGLAFKSMFVSLFITTIMIVFVISIMFSPVRYLIKKFALQPGQGPSKEAQEKGWFKTKLVGKSESKAIVKGSIYGKGDPGYKVTSMFVSQAALCILHDMKLDQSKENKVKGQGGVLTPASAMGQKLIDRLSKNGIEFKIES